MLPRLQREIQERRSLVSRWDDASNAYQLNSDNNTSRKVNKDKIALICPCVGVTVETING